MKLTSHEAFYMACFLNGRKIATLNEAVLKKKGARTIDIKEAAKIQIEIDQLLAILDSFYLEQYAEIESNLDIDKILENKDKIIDILGSYIKPEKKGADQIWHSLTVALTQYANIERIKGSKRK